MRRRFFSLYKPLVVRLRGQSNAIGVNVILNNLPDYLKGKQNGRHIYINGSWQVLEAGVNNQGQDIPTSGWIGYYGIEMRLMYLLYEHFKNDIWMLKFGRGGIPLYQLAGDANDWNAASMNNDFFPQSIVYTNQAISKLSKDFDLVDIWIQGESDANATYSAVYEANLTNFINSDRAAHGKGNTPFIIVSLSNLQTALNATQRSAIKNAQRNVASIVYESAVFTTKSGLQNVCYIEQNEPVNANSYNLLGQITGTDNLHYNEIGLRNIASHVFEAVKYFKK